MRSIKERVEVTGLLKVSETEVCQAEEGTVSRGLLLAAVADLPEVAAAGAFRVGLMEPDSALLAADDVLVERDVTEAIVAAVLAPKDELILDVVEILD